MKASVALLSLVLLVIGVGVAGLLSGDESVRVAIAESTRGERALTEAQPLELNARERARATVTTGGVDAPGARVVSVLVLSAADESALARAELLVESSPFSSKHMAFTADEAGKLSIRVPEFAELFVSAVAPGFARKGVLLSEADLESEVTLRLERAATLDVRVLDGGGEPVEGARVTLQVELDKVAFPRAIAQRHGTHSRSTDALGVATFDELPPNLGMIAGLVKESPESKPSRAPRPARVVRPQPVRLLLAPGERRHLDLAKDGVTTVTGTVFDSEGLAVADHPVSLHVAPSKWRILNYYEFDGPAETTETDVYGRFSFGELEPGMWWLKSSAETVVAEPVFVQTSIDVPLVDRSLVVHSGLSIWGRVVGTSGSRDWCTVYALSENAIVQEQAQQSGFFSFHGLLPGSYELGTCPGERFSFDGSEPEGNTSGDTLRVEAGAKDVQLSMRVPGELRVRVLDESGAPLIGKCLVSKGYSAEPRLFGTATERLEDGEACFRTLEFGGTYYLFAHSEGRAVTSGPVRVGSAPAGAPLVLRASRAARLELLNPSEDAACAGELYLGEVCVGAYLLLPLQTRQFVVPPGEITVYELELRELRPTRLRDWKARCEVGEVPQVRLE